MKEIEEIEKILEIAHKITIIIHEETKNDIKPMRIGMNAISYAIYAMLSDQNKPDFEKQTKFIYDHLQQLFNYYHFQPES